MKNGVQDGKMSVIPSLSDVQENYEEKQRKKMGVFSNQRGLLKLVSDYPQG